MFLNKIKIKGFKSFAKSTTIDFDSPLTAIVGPNGSGKSNIVDAVRWVLGEQSAKTLRGSRMADVIFAGSEDRKSLNKASVTLYLNNEKRTFPIEKDELRIRRKVNSSGESDYILNGSVCRLKDIQELLLDTGLGNDTYSIIGQGKIDSIIKSKPEKLRELFEEAAGISKHKARKEEAEKRLEKTNKSLQRIEDLIIELDKQVKPLKKSAEKAKKYKRIYGELKKLETGYLMTKWDQQKNKLEESKSKKDELETSISSKENEHKRISVLLAEKKEIVEKKQEKYEEKKEKYHKTKAKIEEVNNNLKIIEERKKNLQREKKSEQDMLVELKFDRKKLKEKEEKLAQKVDRLSREYNQFKLEVDKKEKDFVEKREEIEFSKEKIASIRSSVLDENGEIRDLDLENEKLKEKINSLENNLSDQREKKDKLKEEMERLNKKRAELEEKKERLIQKRSKKDKYIEKLEFKKDEFAEKLNKLTEDYNQIKNEITSKKSTLEFLQGMEENYKGYYQGVKNILKKKKEISGIRGVVADLIDVEKKYEKAIETALGAKLQNIIVEDDSTAKKCIDYLKRNNKGRATFLPLNMVQGNKFYISDEIRNMKGFLGFGVELVSYNLELKEAIENLLGRVIISDNMDQAVKISKKMNSRLRIVTLSGDTIYPGGAMSGGSSANKKNGLLGRTRKIERLEEETNKLKDRLGQLSDKGIKVKDKYGKTADELDKERENLHGLELKISELENKLESNKEFVEKEKEEKENLREKIEENRVEISRLKDKKEKVKEDLDLINDGNFENQNLLNEKEKELENMEKKMENIRDQLTEKKVRLAEIEQNKEAAVDERKELKERLVGLKEKKSKSNEKIEKISSQFDQLTEKKEELQKKNSEFTRKAEILDEKYKNIGEEIDQKKELIRDWEEKIKNLQKDLNEKKDKSHKLDLKINRLQNRLDRISERLEDEYGLNPYENCDVSMNIDELSQAKKKISELKKSIKKLKPVNLAAVQEYKELKDRLDYLTDQSADLKKAKSSIIEVITDIEETMGQLFYDTYLEVKDRFENIFDKLFDGGMAELTLNKPDNLLETGVEINAQPPGKKLKKLSLMSGGERALTAIALVFAFLRVNPSPFYILDEIDAPLDDANVVRFAKYLQEYSSIAQFVLVTHSKQMMTEVDTIYGVTMEESGISKLISLRLNEKKVLV